MGRGFAQHEATPSGDGVVAPAPPSPAERISPSAFVEAVRIRPTCRDKSSKLCPVVGTRRVVRDVATGSLRLSQALRAGLEPKRRRAERGQNDQRRTDDD